MSVLVDCPHCSTRVLPLPGRTCPACRQDVDTPPDPQMLAARAAEAALEVLVRRVEAGVDPAQIGQSLAQHGVDARTTRNIVAQLERSRVEQRRLAGRRNMTAGGLFCVGGITLTAITLAVASGRGGGLVIVAWGAILGGFVQFFRGFYQSQTDPT